MLIVGIRDEDGSVWVGALTADGSEVTVITDLATFWASPADHLAAQPRGETLSARDVALVPPALPGARVICVGLNYQDHVSEGSFKDQDLPEFPTLFAR